MAKKPAKSRSYVETTSLQRLVNHHHIPVPQIAEELGVHRTAVAYWLRTGEYLKVNEVACEALLRRMKNEEPHFSLFLCKVPADRLEQFTFGISLIGGEAIPIAKLNK